MTEGIVAEQSVFTPNSFQIANAIIDKHLAEITPGALKCYLFIVRKTRGWHKQEDSIAVSQFIEATGLTKSVIYRGLQWLEERNYITRTKGESAKKIGRYVLVDAPKPYRPVSGTVPPAGIDRPVSGNRPSRQREQQNTLNTKNTITKNNPRVVGTVVSDEPGTATQSDEGCDLKNKGFESKDDQPSEIEPAPRQETPLIKNASTLTCTVENAVQHVTGPLNAMPKTAAPHRPTPDQLQKLPPDMRARVEAVYGSAT